MFVIDRLQSDRCQICKLLSYICKTNETQTSAIGGKLSICAGARVSRMRFNLVFLFLSTIKSLDDIDYQMQMQYMVPQIPDFFVFSCLVMKKKMLE